MAQNNSRNIPMKTQKKLIVKQAGFDGRTGEHIIKDGTNVSRNAHITAFNENGPRGDKNNVHNNGYENLILLTSDNHDIVDDEDNVGRYSVEKMKEMKSVAEKKGSECQKKLKKSLVFELLK